MAAKLTVLEKDITTFTQGEFEYINIPDITRYKNTSRTDDLNRNWLRNRNTIKFLGIWEQLNNPNFNPVEFDGIKKKAGSNSFPPIVKQWVSATNAIGNISKADRYGGTYALKENLIPVRITSTQKAHVQSPEADLLNVVLFRPRSNED